MFFAAVSQIESVIDQVAQTLPATCVLHSTSGAFRQVRIAFLAEHGQ
jgi:hypothetical protein